MLISSLIAPKNVNIGDYWYCLEDKELYEFVSIFLVGQWLLVAPNVFSSATFPPPNGLTGSLASPLWPIWRDSNDPNRIPHRYSGFAWIPIVPANFTFPPQSPVPGDMWFDTNSLCGYAFGSNQKWQLISSAGQNISINSTTATNTGQNISVNGSNSVGITSGSGVTISPLNQSPTITRKQTALSIVGLVDIYPDGTIVYGPNYTPAKTAKAMWEAIAHFSPVYKEGQEVLSLRQDVEDYKLIIKAFEDCGYTLPPKKADPDPIAAWNAAMGVII